MPEPEDRYLEGLKILVVEDDFLVARSMELTLARLGCEVLGPVGQADEACDLVKQAKPDAAVLDVRLTPGTSAPVARALQYRSCPFLFVTAYQDLSVLPDDLRGFRVLFKPVDRDTLGSAIRELVQSTGQVDS
jgi:two-component SAPR family response regulator